MKKLTLLAAAAIITLGLTSCKKDYTCTCTEPGITTADVYAFNDLKKKDAEAACDTWNSLYLIGGGSCNLEKN